MKNLVRMTHAKRGALLVPPRKVKRYEKAGWTAVAKPADSKAAAAAKTNEQKASS